MAKCEYCTKTPQFGHNVSHSKSATNKKWLPNIQTFRIEVNGMRKKVKLCTQCIRTYHKSGMIGFA